MSHLHDHGPQPPQPLDLQLGYRALTAARARAALDLGCTLLNSDSTEYSRPILERSGLIRVSTTTPYTWKK